jgi:hypothetical protein
MNVLCPKIENHTLVPVYRESSQHRNSGRHVTKLDEKRKYSKLLREKTFRRAYVNARFVKPSGLTRTLRGAGCGWVPFRLCDGVGTDPVGESIDEGTGSLRSTGTQSRWTHYQKRYGLSQQTPASDFTTRQVADADATQGNENGVTHAKERGLCRTPRRWQERLDSS